MTLSDIKERLWEIGLRLFLAAAGCGMVYAGIDCLLSEWGQAPWTKNLVTVLSTLFLWVFGLGSLVGAIWFNRLMDVDFAIDERRERRRKQRERERSPEEKLRRERREELGLSLLWFAYTVFLFIGFCYSFDQPLFAVISGVGTVWCLYKALNPLIHSKAKQKGWSHLAERTQSAADLEADALRRREERMARHRDDGTLLLLTESGDIRNALEDYAEFCVSDNVVGSAQLWQLEGKRFALTFPCGARRKQLMELLCLLSEECSEVRLWVPSALTKRTTGRCTLASVDDEGNLVAASDDGRQWRVPLDDDDELLFSPSPKHLLTYQNRPEIDLKTARKRALYY